MRYETTADQIAGLLIEPIEGEAGVIIPPDDYFPQLRTLTNLGCDILEAAIEAVSRKHGLGIA